MKDKAGVERPWLHRAIRATEIMGIVALLYGLAASEWLMALFGVAIIVTSYRIYRRWFDVVIGPDDGSMGMSGGGD